MHGGVIRDGAQVLHAEAAQTPGQGSLALPSKREAVRDQVRDALRQGHTPGCSGSSEHLHLLPQLNTQVKRGKGLVTLWPGHSCREWSLEGSFMQRTALWGLTQLGKSIAPVG